MTPIIYRAVAVLWAITAVLYAVDGDRPAFIAASGLLAAWTFLSEFAER